MAHRFGHAGLEAQRRDPKAAGCKKIYEGQVSSMKERPQLQAALDYAREGDTLVVTKLDRLARSARHLSELVDALETKGVALRILRQAIGMGSARRRALRPRSSAS